MNKSVQRTKRNLSKIEAEGYGRSRDGGFLAPRSQKKILQERRRFSSQPLKTGRKEVSSRSTSAEEWTKKITHADAFGHLTNTHLSRQRLDSLKIAPYNAHQSRDESNFEPINNGNLSQFSDSESLASSETSEISMIEHDAKKNEKSTGYIFFGIKRRFDRNEENEKIDTSICSRRD